VRFYPGEFMSGWGYVRWGFVRWGFNRWGFNRWGFIRVRFCLLTFCRWFKLIKRITNIFRKNMDTIFNVWIILVTHIHDKQLLVISSIDELIVNPIMFHVLSYQMCDINEENRLRLKQARLCGKYRVKANGGVSLVRISIGPNIH
jgi:hypothetical protein